MTGTVLVTGCSSGFGKVAALKFRQAGSNVVATMQNTELREEADASENILLTQLDVRDAVTIDAAIARGIDKFGRTDCVVNDRPARLRIVCECVSRLNTSGRDTSRPASPTLRRPPVVRSPERSILRSKSR